MKPKTVLGGFKEEGACRALAISIVLYQPDTAQLAHTLHTLAKALQQAVAEGLQRAELWLIDNSPQPRADAQLSEWQAALGPLVPVRYDWTGKNQGFGSGHNRAFRYCVTWADAFLVANPDVDFTPDSVAAGLSFIARHRNIGLVAPALLEADDRLRPACFRYPDLLTLLARFVGGRWAQRRSKVYECRDWSPLQEHFAPPLVSGCCMLFRTSCFAGFGGFDPRYFLYFEDFDLSWRIGRAGASAYCPAMRIRHFGGDAGRKGWNHIRHFLASAWRFYSAHGWCWTARRTAYRLGEQS